jgi:phage terminase large subunit-like protein
MITPLLNESLINTISIDQSIRINLTKNSALYFATIYFSHYFSYDFAPFQYEMFQLIEDAECLFVVAISFRGSGKSTLFTTIAPLWSIMGIHQKKHVLIVCQTQEQARSHMASIKAELETNELLHTDLGPFKESVDTWNSMSLEFSRYGAKITAVSIDQSIRGIRHKQHRPDLIITDDIEDSSSVKTKEARKRIQELYSSEIAPLGDVNTKIIMIGNYLHPNSLLATLKESIDVGKLKGKNLFIPLVNDEQQIAWPQKFPSFESIDQLRERVADHRIWMQEYLLKIVPDDDQLITYEDICWYNNIPTGWEPNFQFRAAGIDLAISKDSKADYTAVVSGTVYRLNDEYHVFIDRNPTNKRLNFRETIDFVQCFNNSFPGTHLFIESTGYQRSLVQQLNKEGIDAHEVQIGSLSKQERLALTTNWISKGYIHFPEGSSTDLVNQIVNFGSELHDDLADAFSLLIIQIMEYARNNSTPIGVTNSNVQFIKFNRAKSRPLRKPTFNARTLANDPLGWND